MRASVVFSEVGGGCKFPRNFVAKAWKMTRTPLVNKHWDPDPTLSYAHYQTEIFQNLLINPPHLRTPLVNKDNLKKMPHI